MYDRKFKFKSNLSSLLPIEFEALLTWINALSFLKTGTVDYAPQYLDLK